jgi:hypothetical protein
MDMNTVGILKYVLVTRSTTDQKIKSFLKGVIWV